MPPISGPDLADAIVAARMSGGSLDDGAPLTLEQGYAVAERVAPRLGAIAGWKVGATNPGAQAFLRIGEPLRGRIYREALHRSPAAFAPPGARPCEAEPEIVLEAGKAGEPVRAWLGIEIVRPSRDDAQALGAGFIVADNAAHVALVIGPEIPIEALARPAGIRVELFRNGEAAGEGGADAVLGDPRRSLEWLAGKGLLRVGDLVATGAMCRAVPFAAGDLVEARFPDFGTVAARWPGTDKL
jgi:2-keto-4-pentenoate hydratase